MGITNACPDISVAAAEAQQVEVENSVPGAMGQPAYLGSVDLEGRTGIPASTWRYWAINNVGPRSFKLGRRRLWRWRDVEAWIQAQEAATATGGY